MEVPLGSIIRWATESNCSLALSTCLLRWKGNIQRHSEFAVCQVLYDVLKNKQICKYRVLTMILVLVLDAISL